MARLYTCSLVPRLLLMWGKAWYLIAYFPWWRVSYRVRWCWVAPCVCGCFPAGYGKRKGTANARMPEKIIWMRRMRTLRRLLRKYRTSKKIDNHLWALWTCSFASLYLHVAQTAGLLYLHVAQTAWRIIDNWVSYRVFCLGGGGVNT